MVAEIYAFHGCRPPFWIFHLRFPYSSVVRYRYMFLWYGWPRKHRYGVGIALLASPGADIYASHGYRPPSWIFHFRFPPSLVLQYWYMSHWYGWPRKHRYSHWNRISIEYGNGYNRFAVSTSGLRPPCWICPFRSLEKVFRTLLSLSLIKMSHGWYETYV